MHVYPKVIRYPIIYSVFIVSQLATGAGSCPSTTYVDATSWIHVTQDQSDGDLMDEVAQN